MKKFFSFFVLISIFFSFTGKISAELPTADFTWSANAYEGVKKYEFVLDLKGSVIEQTLNSDKSRVSSKGKNSRGETILGALNVNEFEEKLVLRLTSKNGASFDFTNFDYPGTKKFHDIYLIEQNGKLKANVVIYIHNALDFEVGTTFSSGLKSAKYLYLGIKNGKPYKKARVIKIK